MRQDIQCLRGIAIISVFLFHLLPNLFFNGFLGVDIFFVISGYLMARNLTKSKLTSIRDFLEFYYRRFRRILPLYYLLIFLIIIMVHLWLPYILWENSNRYSIASLFLMTNQLVIHDQADYFNSFRAESTAINAFLHLWSLSLEMQFYLLVPCIFFALQILKSDYLKLLAAILTTTIGFVCFALVLDSFAFNFMFLRLWQFSAGFVALFWSKIEQKLPEKNSEKSETAKPTWISEDDQVTVALVVLGVCIMPYDVNVLVIRPLVTVVTAFIIKLQSESNQILNSKTLSYIGDISYVTYLVHWPVISIFLTSSVNSYVFCIVTTVLASIALHHLFEKQYLQLDFKPLILLLLILVSANFLLQYSVENQKFWKQHVPAVIQKIVDRNLNQLNVYSQLDHMKNGTCAERKLIDPGDKSIVYAYCRYPKKHGNVSVMTIGNSYVMQFTNPIKSHFKQNYSDYRYYSLQEGFTLYADSYDSSNALKTFKSHVARHKPDVLFIIAKYSRSLKALIQANDTLLNQISENIEFYERHARKVYILGALPTYSANFLNVFLQNVMRNPEDMEKLHLNRKKADEDVKNVKKRFEIAGRQCKKCRFIDLNPAFLEREKYLTFDRTSLFSYHDNTGHLLPAGVKLCEPILKKIVEGVLNSM
ncbi:Acyltransferase [Caenorhabditis elegans]|uniref:Acyltransferase n=1 Tax=Caenorhabditis elegans TaxID=6239 RepID=P91310_CAEEL|nr:Acyltransferase [Caenorhabditis elegans]CCD71441.1 Acyltransferase [Caenorhabditis elegans]|eukprot:NP_493935.3 O-ACyltransferase homolog [Caenorhabditis elegans]